MKIVFFGTSGFAARILQFLLQKNCEVTAIVTRPDRPQGRMQLCKAPPVKEMAQKISPNIPIYQPEKASTEPFCEEMRRLKPDLFLVVAYGEIIKTNLLSVPSKACINIHASLLPKYRGAAPMQRCLMNGDVESGVTIMDMVLQMDAGDILVQEKVSIPLSMNCGLLEEALLQASFRALDRVLSDFDVYYQNKVPQDGKEVSFAAKILPEETGLDWTKGALELHHFVRALSPSPGAWCRVRIGEEVKRLKILSSLPDLGRKEAPGRVLSQEGILSIGCGEGVLNCLEVQLEGKKAMPSADFLKGLRKSFSLIVE